jgi:hypothetical protein
MTGYLSVETITACRMTSHARNEDIRDRNVKWVACHHGAACPCVADGADAFRMKDSCSRRQPTGGGSWSFGVGTWD